MPETIDLDKIQVKHKGMFVFNNVVSTVRRTVKKKLYGYLEKKHKYKPDEHEITIECDKKVNDYIKYEMFVLIVAVELKEVELIKDGQKTQAQHGRVLVEITGKLTLDWMKRFEGSEWSKILREVYHKYIVGRQIKTVWIDQLAMDMFDLGREVRRALEMEA